MAKYSFEFKKKVVQSYLNGEGSLQSLCNQYSIPCKTIIQEWIASYKQFGDSGLLRSRRQQKYSFEFKVSVVELYLTSELSYQEVALQKGLTNPSMVARWVLEFQAVGPEALRPKKKGRKKTLSKSSKKDTVVLEPVADSTRSVDTSAEHVKELEDELLRLRIENAFLKELRRLRLEEEALLKKQRESFAASEENSN